MQRLTLRLGCVQVPEQVLVSTAIYREQKPCQIPDGAGKFLTCWK
jgi:hypothetical protein